MTENFSIPIFISYEKLPAGRDWKINNIYEVRLTLKQTKMDETGVSFEVISATPLSEIKEIPSQPLKKELLSDSGRIRY